MLRSATDVLLRLAVALSLITGSLVALHLFAPQVRAECPGDEGPRSLADMTGVAFTARVARHDFIAHDVQGDYDTWRVRLDVQHVYRGAVPDSIETIGSGAFPGCPTARDVSAFEVGDELFLSTNMLKRARRDEPGFYGYVMVWRREDGAWNYLKGALRPDAYWLDPPAAVRATTTAQILRLVAPAHLPGTSTAPPAEPRGTSYPLPVLLAALVGAMAGGAMAHQRWSATRSRRSTPMAEPKGRWFY